MQGNTQVNDNNNAVLTVSDEQGNEESKKDLELRHLLENVIIIILERTKESVQFYGHDWYEYPAYYLSWGAFLQGGEEDSNVEYIRGMFSSDIQAGSDIHEYCSEVGSYHDSRDTVISTD